MRYFLVLCFLWSCNYSGYCQVLEGVVKDQGSQPLELALVSLLQDSIQVRYCYTDSSGHFKFSLMRPDSYRLKITYPGILFKEKYIDLARDTVLDIRPDSMDNSIGEVVVVSSKPLVERKVDRTVFNVENSIAGSTGDALDALKVTPGVQVQNDQVLLIGKSNLSVTVNGRPVPLSGEDLTSYLKSIPGDNIKSIEVITTPPSKYQAQGNSGIINIILKKNAQTLWSDNMRASYFQTTYPAVALGNTFIYNKNKIQFQVSADGRTGNQAVVEDGKIYYPDEYWHQVTHRKDQQNYLSGYSSIDYNLNSKTSFGAQYIGSIKRPDISNTYHADIVDATSGLRSGVDSRGESVVKNHFNSLNLHLVQKLDSSSGKQFAIDFDYFTYSENKDRNFSNQNMQPDGTLTDFFSANNLSGQQINNYSAKVDFDYPTPIAKFTYGARVSFSNTDNSVAFFNTTSGDRIADMSQTDRFKYSENTQALYADIEKGIGKNWQAKFGLRFENTQTKGQSLSYSEVHKYNYAKVFPTFYLLRQLNKDNSLTLSYSRRLDRPAFWELNPFKWYINATSYATGNPFLQPDYVHNIDLAHTFKNKLVSKLSFSITQNGFSQVPSVDSQTFQQVFTRTNYFTLYGYGIAESYTFNKWYWWESSNQVALNYYKSVFFNENILTPAQQGFRFIFVTNNSFVLTKDKTVSGFVNFWYCSPYKFLLYETSQSYALDFGIKKLLLNKKLQCVLYVTDIFKSNRPVSTTFTNGIKQAYSNYYDNRSLRIMIRYSMGSDKTSGKIRNTGNQEEVGRSGH